MVPVGMLHTYFVWVGPTAVPLSQPVAGGAADADPGASSVTAAAAPSSAANTAALPQCDRVRASTRVVPTLPSLRPRCYRSNGRQDSTSGTARRLPSFPA